MTVIGVDPGTAITGFGILTENDQGNLQAVSYGVVLTPAGERPEKRLLLLYQKFNEILLLHQPSSAAVEKLFFQKNAKTAMAVGQARGVLLLCLAQSGIPVSEYSPLEVKQAVVGFGGADKQQVQQMVKALLGLDVIPRPDDAADALAVAICHINSQNLAKYFDPGADFAGGPG